MNTIPLTAFQRKVVRGVIIFFMPQRETHHAHDGPHKDRWHYMDYRDGKHDENYIEWKYFNFIQDGLAGYIIYYILDPEHKSHLGGGRLVARIFKDRSSLGLIKQIDIDKIQFDPVSASVVMDRASIAEKDAHHYEINSGFDDMSWDLSYKQKTPTIDSFSNVNPGLMPWERASWLIKMPRAQVEGSIRVGGKTFSVNGLGYSDTNWGEILPFFSRYEWGQFNDGTFSLVFGVLFRLNKIKSSYFYATIGEEVIPLTNAQCTITHTGWLRDKDTGMKIPSQSIFTLTQGEYRLQFTTKLIQADSPGLQIHRLLPKTVVSEQLVQYDGRISKLGRVLHEFSGEGFEEWSTKTWRKIAVPF